MNNFLKRYIIFKVDKAPIHFACQHGHSDIVKMLVSGGAHVNAVDMVC